MMLYYRYFHPASPKKCHCCMLYYHMLYKCCPCHDVTLFHGTPYRRKVNADETSSEFEYGNSNSRNEQHVICRIDGDSDSDSSNMDENKLSMLHPRLTSTPGNDLNDKYENFIERSLEILDESVSEDATFTKSLNATNPDDKTCDRDDAAKNALILKSLPGGQTGPSANRGNSTLVREWVKKTQDLYCPKEETVVNVNSGKAISDFGTLRHATKDEREFMQMHFGNFDEKPTGRRDILRLKSFSKKDRQQSSTATEQMPGTNNVSNLRNTFREAFGFHTVEPSAAEKRNEMKKIIRKQPKRRCRKKSKLWTVVDIDGESPDHIADCKTSDLIPDITNRVSINKISARLDQPPESPHDDELQENALRLTARNKIRKELRSSRPRGRAHNWEKYGGCEISQNSKRRSPCKALTSIEDPQFYDSVVPLNDENMVAVDEESQHIQDDDDIPYVDSSETNHAQNIALADRCRKKDREYVHESETVAPQTSDNQICKSCPTTSKEKRISKLCSEYFGPIIQIKGKTVTVKHRDDEQLEIRPTEPPNSNPVSRTNTNICDISDGLEVYPQPNAAQRSEEPISSLEPHPEAKQRNAATLQIFKPSIIRNNIAQTLVAEGRGESRLTRKPQDVNKQRMGKYAAHKSTEESNARKKLSFMKSSKSYDISNSKLVQTDAKNSFKANFIVTEDDLVKENQSLKSADGLSCSMERMLDDTDNYKIHLKDTDHVKKKRLSPNKSKKTVNRKTSSKRRTLGAIENM